MAIVVADTSPLQYLFQVDQFDLCAGERAVFSLAIELGDALVVLDDAAARAAAEQLGLTTTGTLGILLLAKERHLIAAVVPVISKLEARGFRITEPVRRRVIELSGE